MKGMFVVNPTSGMQVHQNTAHLAARKMLREGIVTEANFVYTTGKGSACDAVSRLRPGEYDFVMAVGGDGTVNEVVNGLVAGGSDIPLAILRAGTTNDFATAMGLPTEPNGIARMVSEYRTERIDVGRINGRYFLNVAAGGLLSEIAHNVPSESKSVLGRLAYYLEGLKEISSLHFETEPIRYETESESFEAETFLLIVSNSCSVGGFANIAPRAKVNDGLFDVCIIKAVTPVDVVPLFTQINVGTHIHDKKCVSYFQTPRLRVTDLRPSSAFGVDYDGERGDPMPLEIEVVPGAVRMLVPGWTKKTKKMFV